MYDQFKEYESGTICSMHGREDEIIRAFGGKLAGNSLHGILDIDGIIIILLKLICKNSMGKHVWFNLANIVKKNAAVGDLVGSYEDKNEHIFFSWLHRASILTNILLSN